MTSEKLSRANKGIYVRMQKDMTSHRTWLVALSGLLFFLCYVVGPLIAFIFVKNNVYELDSGEVASSLRLVALASYGLEAVWLSFAVVALAVLFAFSGFAFLYKNRSLDFYESEPFTRRQRFMMIWTNNMLLFTLMLLFATAIGMFFTLIFVGIRPRIFLEILIEMVRLLLLFFASCGVASLAATLAGDIVIAILLYFFISSVEFWIGLARMACQSIYYTTILYQSDPVALLKGFTSPAFMDLSFSDNVSNTGFSMTEQMKAYAGMVPTELKILLCGICFTVAAYFAYKYRSLEHAGRGLCYSFMESVVKITIAIILGIFSGLLMDMIFETRFHMLSFAFLFIVLLVVSLTCLIGEVIFAKSIHAITRRAWQIPLCCAAALVILYGYKTDITGFDSYVPNPEQVESAAIAGHEGAVAYRGVDDSDEAMRLTGDEVVALCEVAPMGMKNMRQLATTDSYVHDYYIDDEENYWTVDVVWRLKNGKMVYRKMLLPYDVNAGAMDVIIGSEHYKDANYMLSEQSRVLSDTKRMKHYNITVDYTCGASNLSVSADADAVLELVEAYQEDIVQYDFSFASETAAEGEIDINIDPKNYEVGEEVYYYSLEVYPTYTNTIACLKELGIYHESSLQVTEDEVTSFYVSADDMENYYDDTVVFDEGYFYMETINSGENVVSFDTPEEIAAITEIFHLHGNYGAWYKRDGEEEGERYYLTAICANDDVGEVYGYVRKDEAPDFLREAMDAYLKKITEYIDN